MIRFNLLLSLFLTVALCDYHRATYVSTHGDRIQIAGDVTTVNEFALANGGVFTTEGSSTIFSRCGPAPGSKTARVAALVNGAVKCVELSGLDVVSAPAAGTFTCPPGSVPNTSHSACDLVEAGFYRGTNDISALPCPSGQFSFSGATICEKIPANMQRDPTAPPLSGRGATWAELTPCPSGQTSTDGVCTVTRSNTTFSATSIVSLVFVALFALVGAAGLVIVFSKMRTKKAAAAEAAAAAEDPARAARPLRRRQAVKEDALTSRAAMEAALKPFADDALADSASSSVPVAPATAGGFGFVDDVAEAGPAVARKTPVEKIADVIDQCAAQCVDSWAFDRAPCVLAARIMSLFGEICQEHGDALEGYDVVKAVVMAAADRAETATPASADLLLEQMRASPYFVLCNPLNYRGTAWPFPGARMLFDKLFSFQDDETGVEDASTTLVRRMYMLAVAEQSAKLRETLATGTAADLAAEPSLTAPMRNLLDSARAYSGTVDVTLSATGKSFQLLADEENVTRALRNAPLHLASAIRMSPAAAQIPVGNALEAIRIASVVAIRETAAIAPAIRSDLATALRQAGVVSAGRARALSAAIGLHVAGPVFTTASERVRAAAAPRLAQHISAQASDHLCAACERVILPLIILFNHNFGNKGITLSPAPDSNGVLPLFPPTTKGTNAQPTQLPPLEVSSAPGAVQGDMIKALAGRQPILAAPSIIWSSSHVPPAVYIE